MVIKATQASRSVSVTSPLGEDVILFSRMTGAERLSTLFIYQLDVISENDSIDAKKLLGQSIDICLDLPDGQKRYFNGIVSRFGQKGATGTFANYRITVRPWLWLLTRTADCRIFQNKSVPDIVKEVFRERGFTDFEELLIDSYAVRDYCVQYRESDFDFVSRLLEDEGIYYYFRHGKGKHTLVLSDSISAHHTVQGYERVPFFEPGNIKRRKRDHIYEWAFNDEIQSGRWSLTDYDFTKPKVDLNVTLKVPPRWNAHNDLEVFDFPGEYTQIGEGEHYVRARIERLESEWEHATGRGSVRGLGTGALFTLDDFPRLDQNREYLIVSAIYQMQSNEYVSASGLPSTPEEDFQCHLTAIESRQTYRPPLTTKKPKVSGLQTAFVVGKVGEEIWTDKYGRVKVQFHWDRQGKSDENSSCWVRVGQYWAGKRWGAIHIPRIGQEVLVDFLDGDPDKPIIVGSVYNADQMPPYDLPTNATQSGVKSRSSKDGDPKAFNEIRFEDKKGQEEIYIHTRQMTTVIEGSHSPSHYREVKTGDCVTDVLKGSIGMSAPNGRVKSDGNWILIEGTTDIKLHCGSSSITMNQGDIEFRVGGSTIKINAGEIALNVSGSTISLTGGEINISSSGLVRIN